MAFGGKGNPSGKESHYKERFGEVKGLIKSSKLT
jgi:hypothetical protein